VRTTRRERRQRVSDSEAAALKAWDELLAEYRPLAIEAAPPVRHSATWGERTDVVDYGSLPAFTPDLAPADGPQPLPAAPLVTVTDDPPGRHEKPRAYLVHAPPEPYCSTCSSREHWTDGHTGPDPLVTQMVADRAESRARHAIDDDLRAAGFKIHDDNGTAVESMFTRAMARAIADVEAAR
jgi:hypothetical protein